MMMRSRPLSCLVQLLPRGSHGEEGDPVAGPSLPGSMRSPLAGIPIETTRSRGAPRHHVAPQISVDELILAALQGIITRPDAARLDAWRRASLDNEEHFQAMSRLWVASAGPDPLEATVGAPPTLKGLLRPFRPADRESRPVTGEWPSKEWREADRGRRRGPSASRRGVALVRWGAALSAAAVLLFMVGRWSGQPSVPAAVGTLSASEFTTDAEEMATARLGDGSVVRLAPQSRLHVAPGGTKREVWLDGEAFFAVARDTAHPFAVRTRAGTVEVLGTRFNLRVVGSELQLVVTEGSVALSSGVHRRVIKAGEVASVSDGGEPRVERPESVDSLLTWKRGFLSFQRTPLSQVARELEQQYGVRVLLPDSTLAQRTVTAWFTNQSFDHVLSAICRTVDAHCTRQDSVASIEP